MQYEFDIFQYFSLFKSKKKNIIVIVMASMLLAACSSFLRPPSYISRATLLSGEQDSYPGIDTSSLSSFFLSRMGIQNSSNDIIIAILKSKRMATGINKKFNINGNPKIWWSIDAYWQPGTLNIVVNGSNPDLTQKIANFSIENINKINKELLITINLQMVTVLDPATYGISEGRKVVKNMSISGMFTFIVFALYIFFEDYLKKVK